MIHELMPCPFCRKEAWIEKCRDGRFRVVCFHDEDCYLKGARIKSNIRESLVNQWNRRKVDTDER